MADATSILERMKARTADKKSSSPLDRMKAREAAKLAPIVPDCLEGIPYTGNAEQDSALEMSATLKAFKDRAKAEEKRMQDATDSEFWLCVCFQNRKQKEEFLAKLGLLADGDKYLNGQKVATAIGVELTPTDVSFRDARIDPKYAALAMPLPD